jgi:palmitoyltransferase
MLDKIISKKCKKCSSVKPPNSHHCSICKRCVARMDHHCPWVNNCVGFYSQKFFLQFLMYVFLGSAHGLFLISRQGLYCMDRNCRMYANANNTAMTCISIFLALLFGLFVMIMFCDQVSCITSEMSTLDKLQAKRDKKSGKKVEKVKPKRTGFENLCQVFGTKGFRASWFFPTDIKRVLSIEGEYE